MAQSTLAEALESEHREIDGGIEDYTAGLAGDTTNTSALRRALDGLRRHIYLEETFLFPPLKEAGMAMPIFVMLREHGELWDAIDALEGLLASGTDAANAQNACRELLALLDNHNSKEEPVIYGRADAMLDAATTVQLHEFIASGSLPPGWRCEKAS